LSHQGEGIRLVGRKKEVQEKTVTWTWDQRKRGKSHPLEGEKLVNGCVPAHGGKKEKPKNSYILMVKNGKRMLGGGKACPRGGKT